LIKCGQAGLTVFGIDGGIDLIVKKISKLSFLSAQRIYYITIAVCSYEYSTEKILSLSNILQMSIVQQ